MSTHVPIQQIKLGDLNVSNALLSILQHVTDWSRLKPNFGGFNLDQSVTCCRIDNIQIPWSRADVDYQLARRF
jgi:hypothetical protein